MSVCRYLYRFGSLQNEMKEMFCRFNSGYGLGRPWKVTEPLAKSK